MSDIAATPRDLDELEEALVHLHALERRMPGGGRWPFAGDGPWHLIQGEVGDLASEADWSETLIVTESGQELRVRKVDARAPRPPLDAGEVAEYERMRRWVMLAPADARRIVWEATGHLHRGESRPQWGEMKREMAYPRTPRRMAQVYREALAVILCRLNGWPIRRARALAA